MENFTHPLIIQVLVPVATLTLCLLGLVFYSRYHGVPMRELNPGGLNESQRRSLRRIQQWGLLAFAALMMLRLSGSPLALMVYNALLIPVFVLFVTSFYGCLIAFKRHKSASPKLP